MHDRVSLSEAAATGLVMLATTWCYTAWGLLMSWLFRRTTVAVTCTLASLIVLLAVLPTYGELSRLWDSALMLYMKMWHPFFALDQIIGDPAGALWHSLRYAVVVGGAGWLWLALLHLAMQRGISADWLFEPARLKGAERTRR